MPWKECHVMDERMRFVARLLDGEKMAVLCDEFGISRKTGYKIYDRYKDAGLHGLTDRSRRPHRHANQLPMAVEKTHRSPEEGIPEVGCAQAARAIEGPLAGGGVSGDQHGARRTRSARPCDLSTSAAPSAADGDTPDAAQRAECLVVC